MPKAIPVKTIINDTAVLSLFTTRVSPLSAPLDCWPVVAETCSEPVDSEPSTSRTCSFVIVDVVFVSLFAFRLLCVKNDRC